MAPVWVLLGWTGCAPAPADTTPAPTRGRDSDAVVGVDSTSWRDSHLPDGTRTETGSAGSGSDTATGGADTGSARSDTGSPTDSGSTGPLPSDSAGSDSGVPYDPLCAGQGPGALDIGEGGPVDFQPWLTGSPVPITQNPGTQRYGLEIALRTTGLDTRGAFNTVVRVRSARDDTTFLGLLNPQCPHPGPGWTALRLDFPDEVQADIRAGDWDGEAAEVRVTVTDVTPETTTGSVDVVLTGP